MKKHLLRLRVIVELPPADAHFAVQRGRQDLDPPIAASHSALTFQFPVLVVDPITDPSRLVGEFTQGPPAARFVYINSGTYAGKTDSVWSRRAKVPLAGITAPLVQSALAQPDSALQTRIAGTAKDGGPVCASVTLLEMWKVVITT